MPKAPACPANTAWTSVGLVTTHTVSGLTNVVQYSFEVRAVNGKTPGEGPAAQVHATPGGPPTAPQSLSAAPGDRKVTLTWSAPAYSGSSDLVRYEVRHAAHVSALAASAWTPVGLATTHTVSGLTNGVPHFLEVRAVNGQSTGYVRRVRATPSAVPTAPRSLSATPYDGRVLLSWSAPADDGGAAIVRYEVRHAAGASVPGHAAWTSVGLQKVAILWNLTNGALHSFEVRAVNGETSSKGPAAIVRTTPSGPPTAPQGLSAAPGDGEVALTWSAPANGGGSDLVRYEVRHAAHARELGASAWTSVGLATTHTVSGLTSGVQRIFEVRAVNGKTPGKGPAAQIHATPTGPPTAPRGLSAAPGNGEVRLTWDSPFRNGGSEVVRYEVRHAEGASVPGNTAWTSVRTARVYTVSGLTNGALHSFEVRAVNGKTPGEGPAAIVRATPSDVPSVPRSLSATPYDGRVLLSWSAPADDGGSAIVRYEMRHAAGAGVPGHAAWTSVGTATTHTVSGLTNGALHSFEVRAVNGETPSEGPAAIVRATPSGPPTAPQGLSAAPGDGEVALTWSAPANGGGSDLVRYEVRHAAHARELGASAWTSVGLATTHTVSGLTSGVQRIFEVRAVNGKTPGKGPAAQIHATPTGPPTAPRGLSAAPGKGEVRLTWDSPFRNGGSEVVRYEVRHAEGASVPGNTAWTSVRTARVYTVSGLTNGALHSFEVRAVNGKTPGEGPAAIVRATPSDVPSVPRSLSATPYDGRVLLSWSAPADDGGSAIVRYEMRHAAGAERARSRGVDFRGASEGGHALEPDQRRAAQLRGARGQRRDPRRRTGRDSPGDPERSADRSTGPLRRSGRRRGRADLVGARQRRRFGPRALRGAPCRTRQRARRLGVDFRGARHDAHRLRPDQWRAAHLRGARGQRQDPRQRTGRADPRHAHRSADRPARPLRRSGQRRGQTDLGLAIQKRRFGSRALRGAPRRRRQRARQHGVDFGQDREGVHRLGPDQRRAAQLRGARGQRQDPRRRTGRDSPGDPERCAIGPAKPLRHTLRRPGASVVVGAGGRRRLRHRALRDAPRRRRERAR